MASLFTHHPAQPTSFLGQAKHTLFVEGYGEEGIDPVVLRTLLGDSVMVKPLGPSSHIRSVAKALHRHHPEYYFVIDRDHYDDDTVENSWKNFPDPGMDNLLIWRCREIENYFLLPDYLCRSPHCKVTETALKDRILALYQQRLYLDATNQVLIAIREELKENWIETLPKSTMLSCREEALQSLTQRPEFQHFREKTAEKTASEFIVSELDKILNAMTGGGDRLCFGQGEWLSRMGGKEIFHEMANTCFEVKDRDGIFLHGKEKRQEVVKGLLRLPLERQPSDFQELHRLVSRIVSG